MCPDGNDERQFLVRVSVLYGLLVIAVLFTVDRFWSANWDVEAFLGAARSFYDGGSFFDLYEKGRQQFYWPYVYPPLYALVLAPLVWLADRAFMPAWAPLVAVRAPVVAADVAMAWLLHTIICRTTARPALARLAALAWLFTPITFYQTAIQAHHESVWLLPTVLAFWVMGREEKAPAWKATLLLAIGVAMKQTAVLYTVPFGVYMLGQRRWREVAVAGALFSLVVGGMVLPFHLYSDDFLALVVHEVRNMPVQTQSWIVWLLALQGYLVEQTRSTFPLIRHATLVTLGGALLISLLWWRAHQAKAEPTAAITAWFGSGLVVTLLFFLTSQKVMAYYYVMLVPWLLGAWISAGRVRPVTVALLWTSWIVVSPYYAPWANPARLPLYALLGTLNSLFFLGLLVAAFRTRPTHEPDAPVAATFGWLLLLALGFVLSAWAHPLSTLVEEPGTARRTLIFGLLGLVVLMTLVGYARLRGWVERQLATELTPLQAGHVLAALWFVPLFFTWFTMTREITFIIEKGLWEAWHL
ncbi:MAG: glycosyltransferase 87 family protein [Ardenticatenia bacterium]|nr:glycosyltransferase 87 family protein [Ardenticatenia bacterium]